MSWNYRVVCRTYQEEITYQIHEAYYKCNKRNCKEEHDPTAISLNPVFPSGETLKELKKDINAYLTALNKSILKYEDFDTHDRR